MRITSCGGTMPWNASSDVPVDREPSPWTDCLTNTAGKAGTSSSSSPSFRCLSELRWCAEIRREWTGWNQLRGNSNRRFTMNQNTLCMSDVCFSTFSNCGLFKWERDGMLKVNLKTFQKNPNYLMRGRRPDVCFNFRRKLDLKSEESFCSLAARSTPSSSAAPSDFSCLFQDFYVCNLRV